MVNWLVFNATKMPIIGMKMKPHLKIDSEKSLSHVPITSHINEHRCIVLCTHVTDIHTDTLHVVTLHNVLHYDGCTKLGRAYYYITLQL